MGHGGVVQGNTLVCPYHEWKFTADGCNRYLHAAATSLIDLPGYAVGSILADSRLGRRLTSALALGVGGLSLILTAEGSSRSARLPVGSSLGVRSKALPCCGQREGGA